MNFKILNNVPNKHKVVRAAISGVFVVTLLAGCTSESYEDKVYEPESHQLAEIKRNVNFSWGMDGTFALTAPLGYKVIDYNYDMHDNLQFQDILYTNSESVVVKNPNEFGMPQEDLTKDDDLSFNEGEHVLVTINRGISLIGKEETKEIKAPSGYKIIDYDYSKSDYFEFETCTYANSEPVVASDINDFGTPEVTYENISTVRNPGEHTIVQINRDLTLIGKEEKRRLKAPLGYRIVDYDYDKNQYFEFETIVYENIIPVEVSDPDKLGTPIQDIYEEDSDTFEEGEHVLVEITRNVDLFIGREGLECQSSPEGYKVLDFDYDKNDGLEFITRVYINTEAVKADNENDFGSVIGYQKTIN